MQVLKEGKASDALKMLRASTGYEFLGFFTTMQANGYVVLKDYGYVTGISKTTLSSILLRHTLHTSTFADIANHEIPCSPTSQVITNDNLLDPEDSDDEGEGGFTSIDRQLMDEAFAKAQAA